MENLADCYDEGAGVPRDPGRARELRMGASQVAREPSR
ncbi:SEL1-like repeat protein [Paludisphaera soli]